MASTKKTEPMPVHQYQVDNLGAPSDNSMSTLSIVCVRLVIRWQTSTTLRCVS
jgi:hypothetical protein